MFFVYPALTRVLTRAPGEHGRALALIALLLAILSTACCLVAEGAVAKLPRR